jgi:hypothetical protein
MNQLLDKQNQFACNAAIQQISPIKIKAGFASNRIFSANHGLQTHPIQ